jgi:hypothetical protein
MGLLTPTTPEKRRRRTTRFERLSGLADALEELAAAFDAMYADTGRPWSPERRLNAQLLLASAA